MNAQISSVLGRLLSQTIAPNIDCNLQSGRFWAILIASFRGKVIGFYVLLNSLQPRYKRMSQWSPAVVQAEAVKIWLASVSSGIRAVRSNRHTEMP